MLICSDLRALQMSIFQRSISVSTAVRASCPMYLTTPLIGNDILKTESPLYDAKWSTRSESSSASLDTRKRYIEVWQKMKTDYTPCSPAPIYIPSPSQGENFPRPDIGAVCPFSGKGAAKQRKNDCFCAKIPSTIRKMANLSGTGGVVTIYSEVP